MKRPILQNEAGRGWVGHILQLLFPKLCVGCGRVGDDLCANCVRKLHLYDYRMCHVCKRVVSVGWVHRECRESTYLDGVLVVCRYDELPKRYMHRLKYRFEYGLVKRLVEMVHAYGQAAGIWDGVITWVPLSGWRQRWRGFNQAQLLARGVAGLAGIPCQGLLVRSRHVASQVGQDKSHRQANLQGVMRVVGFRNAYTRRIVIVDDVMTTGTTLEECAKALKVAGVEQVYGAVFARG